MEQKMLYLFKKVVSILLIVSVVSTLWHGNACKAVSKEKEAKTVYAKFLLKQKRQTDTYPSFVICDLDRDGVPELMRKRDIADSIHFYRYSGGKVKKIFMPYDDNYEMFPSVDGSIRFYAENRIFSVRSYCSAGRALHYYQYDRGKMTFLLARNLLYAKDANGNKNLYTYYQGSKKISKKTFKRLKQKYIGKSKKKKISFQEQTKENIQKFL